MIHKESNSGVIIGIFLILGSIISYLPQYYKIIKNKHVNGISHWTQGLSNISCFSAFLGAFMLDYHIFKECPHDKYCGRDLVPFSQLLFVWLCPLINYIIFILYYSCPNYVQTTLCNIKEKTLVYGFFWFYIIIIIGCFMLTTIVLVANWESWKKHGLLFGEILNVLSSIITVFVWIPQIYKTYKEKNIGSLSLISLGIQTPGSFIIFIFQVVISKASWYIGLPYLITGIFQIIILTFGIYYERNKKKFFHNLNILPKEYNSDNDFTPDNMLLNIPINSHYNTI